MKNELVGFSGLGSGRYIDERIGKLKGGRIPPGGKQESIMMYTILSIYVPRRDHQIDVPFKNKNSFVVVDDEAGQG